MKFTPEQVREFCLAQGLTTRESVEECINRFLRSHGLLEENKPLLALRKKVPGEPYLCIPSREVDAHQAALDKVRDGIQLVIAWLMESGDHMRAAHLQDTFNAAVREGCWTPEAP